MPENFQGSSRFETLEAQLEAIWHDRPDTDSCLFWRNLRNWVLDTYDRQQQKIGVHLAAGNDESLESALARMKALVSGECAPPQWELCMTDLTLMTRLCSPRIDGVDPNGHRSFVLDWRVAALLLKAKTLSGRADLSLKELAPPLHVTEHHLGHLFRQQIETTFRRYLWDIRLTTASVLLSDCSLSLKQISNRLGYNDPSNFCNDFRAGFESSPARYRQKLLMNGAYKSLRESEGRAIVVKECVSRFHNSSPISTIVHRRYRE